MSIRYNCRHCGVAVGKIDQKSVDINRLGFQLLNSEERMDMIQYQDNGDIEINTICEDCQEALERNPELHSLQTFLQ